MGIVIKKILLGIFLCVLSASSAFAAMSDDDFLKLCSTGTPQQVEAAVKAGADVNVEMDTGGRAIDLARRNKDLFNTEAYQLLEETSEY